MESHNERKKKHYKSNPYFDTDKSVDNYHLIQPPHKYYAEIMNRIEQAKCKLRKDGVLMIETLVTASPEFISLLSAISNQALIFSSMSSFPIKGINSLRK